MKPVFFGVAFFLLFASVARSETVVTDETQERTFESVPSSPPLSSDDPGTPGPFGFELNILGGMTNSSDTYGGVDANYGIGSRVQLKLEDYAQDGAGFSTVNAGVKWRFVDERGFAVAVYPQYAFGNGYGTTGAYVPLLASYAFGRWSILANVGHFFDPSAEFYSLALGRAFSEDFRLMAEIASTDHFKVARFGFVTALSSGYFESGFFGSVGQSLGDTASGESETTLLVGITLARSAH